ncbi:hypothetical protein HYDPIDRAFT_29911 [Hydnomerulius pinastri MD-312]|uniref:RNase H type-1 domain-containing protein n=1 Tax=Hydnomerulius pinastri MD-312 TaxID=994086 RepID=A0A0C9VX16_9AGAM|nr:hypothetical protein HYDPIDRAFT_29911 [Hydnomerulius pinastri MD-312]
MAVPAYTFKVELIGSRNPPISRTFTIPSSWTFYRLNTAIQYTFGWQYCHLHQWTFEPRRRPPTRQNRGLISLDHRETLLAIHMGTDEDEDDDWGATARARLGEKEIRMCDVWNERGMYRAAASKDGRLGSCYYLYDFGDHWDHEVTLVESTNLPSRKLKVIAAEGAGPLEDAGGIRGWDEVKRAFASTNPSREMNDKKEWARMISPLGEAYDPRVAPTIDQLNTPGEYEDWLLNAAQGSGDFYDPDEDEDPEDEIDERPALDIGSLPQMPLPVSFSMNFGPRILCTPAERRFVTHDGTHPLDLFTPALNACTIRAPRFVHTDNTHMASVLIFIDGVAINENTADVRAGYGLYIDPAGRGIASPLENVPGHARTANRAELRAAVAALKARFWPG